MSLFTNNPSLTNREIIWVLSLAVGWLGSGALITLGTVCLVTLGSANIRKPGRNRNQQRYLQLHVLLILIINLFLLVWNMYMYIKAIFFESPDHLTYFYRDWSNVFVVLAGMLTDGLLVSILSLSMA